MPRGSDDALAKASIQKLIVAVGYLVDSVKTIQIDGGFTTNENIDKLLNDAMEIANRIDAPRGKPAEEEAD